MNLRRMLLLQNSQEDFDMSIPKRFMFFIDGENLVMRYQDMIKQGYIPFPINNVLHYYRKDVFVWTTNIPFPSFNPRFTGIDIVRAYLYTSFQGDEVKQKQIESEIRSIKIGNFSNYGINHTLFPVTFRKRRQNEKAKGVDISLTVDMLSQTFNNNVDVVCFFSGDGDFLPVLKEVVDHGKQIFIFAFSNGLNQNLYKVCDDLFILDERFFDLSKMTEK